MDAFTAQYQAVVATAHLAARHPGDQFVVRVLTQQVEGRRAWVVTVRWTDGPSVPEVQQALDGPPPGVHLMRHVSIADVDHDQRH